MKRGFQALTPERRREIASQGGKAAHAQGRGHEWSSADARIAGAKGGRAARARKGLAHEEAVGDILPEGPAQRSDEPRS